MGLLRVVKPPYWKDLDRTLQFLHQMHQQGYSQSYNQYGSYGQYDSQQAGSDSRGPSCDYSLSRIVLDDYNSDLNFVIEADGVTGSSLYKDGFEYMWAGARATHGVRTGKVKILFIADNIQLN